MAKKRSPKYDPKSNSQRVSGGSPYSDPHVILTRRITTEKKGNKVKMTTYTKSGHKHSEYM